MRQLTQQQLENQVNQFNENYKVGDKVEVLKRANDNETFIDEIKHEASIMGGHTAMTWLKEKGSYDLTFVRQKIRQSSEATVPMRSFGEDIVETSDPCPFCEDGKVTNGTWLQRGSTGTPCCWTCYLKADALSTNTQIQ